MTARKYYSLRTGRHPSVKIDLATLKGLFGNLYARLEQEGYFQEYFGYFCVDAGFVPGKIGEDIRAFIQYRLSSTLLQKVLVITAGVRQDSGEP